MVYLAPPYVTSKHSTEKLFPWLMSIPGAVTVNSEKVSADGSNIPWLTKIYLPAFRDSLLNFSFSIMFAWAQAFLLHLSPNCVFV